MNGSLFANVTLGDFMTAIKNWVRCVVLVEQILGDQGSFYSDESDVLDGIYIYIYINFISLP